MKIHARIQSEQGQDAVKLVRDHENSPKKVASNKNYLRCNLHCKHSDVVLASLRLHSVVQGKKADTVIKRVMRALLGYELVRL